MSINYDHIYILNNLRSFLTDDIRGGEIRGILVAKSSATSFISSWSHWSVNNSVSWSDVYKYRVW